MDWKNYKLFYQRKHTIPQEPASENFNGEIHGIQSRFTGY